MSITHSKRCGVIEKKNIYKSIVPYSYIVLVIILIYTIIPIDQNNGIEATAALMLLLKGKIAATPYLLYSTV